MPTNDNRNKPKKGQEPFSPPPRQNIVDEHGDIRLTIIQSDLIGYGKYSQVYKGELTGSGRTVTVKIHTRALLRPTRQQQDEFYKIKRKIGWLQALKHKGIAEFIDWIPDFPNNRSYIVMQYIEGRGLNQELADSEEPFSQARVLNWALQLLDAMQYLHSQRYIIGALDPSNIVLTSEDNVCLVDFKYLSDIRDTFRDGVKYHGGYPDTPEGNQALENGQREDIRYLGATLFELLTKQKPGGLSLEERKTALSTRHVADSLSEIISKAMSDNVENRYASATEMKRDLQALPTKDRHTRSQMISLGLTLFTAAVMFLWGIASLINGNEQIARYEEMKTQANDSVESLENGQYTEALSYAREAVRQDGDAPPVPPEAWNAMTDAVSAYDYAPGYRPYRSDFDLRGRPLDARFSTDGNRIAVLVEDSSASPSAKRIQIFDLRSEPDKDTLKVKALVTLTASYSPASTFDFLDNDTFLYAGKDDESGEYAVRCYSLSENRELWRGPEDSADRATPVSIAISADGSMVVSLRWDKPFAYLYNAQDIRNSVTNCETIWFLRRPISADTPSSVPLARDNLCALSADGRYLAVSFSDGGLGYYDLSVPSPEEGYHEIIDNSAYLHFEGGFYRQMYSDDASYDDWFFYAASTTNQPSSDTFIQSQGDLIRLSTHEKLLSPQTNTPIHVQTDENGIYCSVGTWLYHANTKDPDVGVEWDYLREEETTIRLLRHAAGRLLVVTENRLVFVYHEDGAWRVKIAEGPFSIAGLSEQYAFLAARDNSTLSVLRWIDQRERGAQEILTYNAEDETDEYTYYAPLGAHVRADGVTAMLYRSTGFRVYDLETETRIDGNPGEDETPFEREGQKREAQRLIYQRFPVLEGDPAQECLKVIYADEVEFYSAGGDKLSSRARRPEDDTVIFLTGFYHVKQNIGGSVEIRNAASPDTDEPLWRLSNNHTLYDASQAGDYLILSLGTDSKEFYSLLLDKNLDVIAKLPEPCEASPNESASTDTKRNATLIFNDMQGHLLKGPLYTLEGLREIAINWRNKTE